MLHESARLADEAEAILVERWHGITEEDARLVARAVDGLSDRELLDRPHLLTGAAIALSLVSSLSEDTGDRAALMERYCAVAEIAAAQGAAHRDRARWLVPRMIAARWRGDFDRALEISELLGRSAPTNQLKSALFDDNEDVAHPGQIALQRGLTALLSGRTSEAMDLFSASHRAGGAPPYRHFAGVNAAANAAMLAAIEGHDAVAEKWLGRVGDAADVPEWCRDLVTIGATIASTILALDVLDLPTAAVFEAELASAGDRFELWPFQLYALTEFDLASNAPVAAYKRLKQVGFERNLTIATEPIADHIVFRAYLDCLIAGGEGGLVLRLAEDQGTPLRSLVPIARTRLLAGDNRGAARVAARAMRRVLIPKRDMWEAAVVHAIAAMKLGETDAALRSFGIVTAGQPRCLPGILARQRTGDVEDLYGLVGATPPLVGQHADPLAAQIVALTARERSILQHLVDGLSTAQIATVDVTSEHTVRTHIKRIYRKLGVSSRAEATAWANHHGLVRWAHQDGQRNTPV